MMVSENETTAQVSTGSTPNTSGQGKQAVVPDEILFRRWNWGAFVFTWIWGIWNNTYVAFLVFVPLLGLTVPFVLATRGYEWAWRNRRWKSLEQFLAAQRKWQRAAGLCIALSLWGVGAALIIAILPQYWTYLANVDWQSLILLITVVVAGVVVLAKLPAVGGRQ